MHIWFLFKGKGFHSPELEQCILASSSSIGATPKKKKEK
jgi:hypothetical protein